MLRYLLVCVSLFAPMKAFGLRSFNRSYSDTSQIVCMVPPLGAKPSKMVDNHKSLPLEEGCRIESEVVHHDNGHTTETISVTFTKEVKRDKEGNVIKSTDISKPRYQKARKSFFEE